MKYNNNGDFKNLSIPAKTIGIPMETTRTDVASWGTYSTHKGEPVSETIGDLLFYEEPKILRRGVIIGEVGDDSLSTFENDHSITVTFLSGDKKTYTKQEITDIIPGTTSNESTILYSFSNFFDLSNFRKNDNEKITLRIELPLSQEEGEQFVSDGGEDRVQRYVSLTYKMQAFNESYSGLVYGYNSPNDAYAHMEKIKEDGTLWRYDIVISYEDMMKCMLSPGKGYFCIKLTMSTE